MSAIFGIVGKREQSVDSTFRQVAREMVQWKPDNAGIYVQPGTCRYVRTSPASVTEALASKGTDPETIVNQLWADLPSSYTVAMGSGLLWNTPESLSEFLPLYDKEAGLCLTADARIDNREELAAHFGCNWTDLAQQPDSWYILQAYKKWGHDCPNHLLGDFAFAIWNEKEQELFAARDIMGVKPLYYTHNENHFAFCTNLLGLFKTGMDKTKDEQWMIDIAAGLHSEAWRSLYVAARKLPAAHLLILKNDNLKVERYFAFDPHEEIQVTDEQEVFDEVARLTREAIKCRMRSIYPVGSEMSSGLDSSLISIWGHQLKDPEQQFIQFSHVLPEWSEFKTMPNIDEQRGIEEICDYAGLKYPVWITGEGHSYEEAFEKFYKNVGEISVSDYPILSDILLDKVQNMNIRTVFSGYGGDECLSHSGAGYFPELLIDNKWKTFFIKSYSFAKRNGQSYIKLITYEILRVKFDFLFKHINSFLINRRAIDYLKERTIKEKKLVNRFKERSSFSNYKTIRERQIKRLSHSYVQFRYEYSNLIGLSYKIEYSYPLTDKRLLSFVLALPYKIKYQDRGRNIIRSIMSKSYPPNLLLKKKRGYTISGAIERMQNDDKLKTFVKFQNDKTSLFLRDLNNKYLPLLVNNILKSQCNE